jgi:hypothetical protein
MEKMEPRRSRICYGRTLLAMRAGLVGENQVTRLAAVGVDGGEASAAFKII